MNYVIDFSLVSIAYLSITALFYWRQPKVPSARNSLFAALLFLGVFFAVMDVVVVIIEPVSYRIPAWVCFFANAVFLMSVQLSSLLFLFYCLVLTGRIRNMPRWRVLLYGIPFIVTMALLWAPIGPGGIFYIDETHIYHRGALYIVLYIDTALYLAASLSVVFIRRKQLMGKKLLCICSFVLILFVAMLIQFTSPMLLLNAMANALALTLIYHVLEAPSTNIDALTDVLNGTAFPLVLRDSYEQNRRSTLLLFPLNSLRLVNHSLGTTAGDALLAAFAGYLRGAFPRGHVFRIAGDAFAVLLTDGVRCDRAQLYRYAAALPEGFRIGQGLVQPEPTTVCINSEDTDGYQDMQALESYVLQLHRDHLLPPVLLADESFRQRLQAANTLERQLEEAIAAQRIQVFYQPLHDCAGRLTALEALVRIEDGQGGFLPTQEAVALSERNGRIHRLSELILHQVCQFVRDNDAARWQLHHIGVNLSALQFTRSDLCEQVSAIMDAYGVSHSLLSFEITETAAAAAADIKHNMRRMIDAGYSFLLDDFGKGYANFNNIAQLPFLCAKIDKMILWEAMESPERMAFLRGVVSILRTMQLKSVCEGVETKEQAAVLEELGVDMLQGYLFSRPLPPETLLAYIERTRENDI